MNTIRHDVFVGNVFHTTTDDQLREVFSQVGKVIAVRQMTEKETGKAKGYGNSSLALTEYHLLEYTSIHRICRCCFSFKCNSSSGSI